jgi:hypothetical protein
VGPFTLWTSRGKRRAGIWWQSCFDFAGRSVTFEGYKFSGQRVTHLLGKVLGPRAEEVTCGVELRDLHFSRNVIGVTSRREMGKACSARRRKENCVRGFGGERRRKLCLEDLGVEGRIILKLELMGGCRQSGPGLGYVTSYCGHSNEPSGAMNLGELFN